jgi:hypothetical protein
MRREIVIFAVASATLLLAGCDLKSQLPPSSIAPICRALIGPIKYTSTLKSPMSKRFAAALLAMDLKQRNQVGVNLGCPQYK